MFSLDDLKRWDRQVDHGNDPLVEWTIDEIEHLADRAESAESVLRVVVGMLEDESHDRDDIADYVKSSLEIINAPQKELDQ
jgi:hypothetical protein